MDNIPSPKFAELSDLVKKSKRTVLDEKKLKELIEEVGEEVLDDASAELLDLARLALKNKKKYSWEEVQLFFKRGNETKEDCIF